MLPSGYDNSHYNHDLTTAVVICAGLAQDHACQQLIMAYQRLVGEWETEKALGECVSFVMTTAISVLSIAKPSLGKAQGTGKLYVDVDNMCIEC